MIRPIRHDQAYPLRRSVLRPDAPPHLLARPGDQDPDTGHYGAFDDSGTLVGIASVFRAPAPGEYAPLHAALAGSGAWQLRGMATAPLARGRGHGARVLEACITHARDRGGEVFWCHARIGARGFYEKCGLCAAGDVYEIAGIGPHVWMWRVI